MCFILPAMPEDLVVLRSGFVMKVSRFEVYGTVLRVQAFEGSIELPYAEVAEIRREDPPVSPNLPEAEPEVLKSETKPSGPKELLDEFAEHYGLPPAFLRSVARVESGFRQSAISHKGALGVMQLMPSTAAALGVDPADIRENVQGGTKYLAALLLRYQNFPDQVRRALAAYNAGPGAVDKHNGVPPYPETIRYVQRVLAEYRRLSQAGQVLTEP